MATADVCISFGFSGFLVFILFRQGKAFHAASSF
jgi:hypothetical protein